MEEEIRRNNYCGVFLGEVKNVKGYINEMSVGKFIGWVESKNVVICSFTSYFSSSEIKNMILTLDEDLKDGSTINRNFMIMPFEESGIYFKDSGIYDKIFSAFDDNEALKVVKKEEIEVSEIDNLNENETKEMIDEILGKETLTKNDKENLTKLSKKYK